MPQILLFGFLLVLIHLFFRLNKTYFYHKISLFGILIFLCIFSLFTIVKTSENSIFYFLSNGFKINQNSEWKWNKEKNKIIGSSFEIRLPKNFFFHSQDTLKIENKIGVGKVQFIVSKSETEPSYYPLVKVSKIEKSKFHLQTVKQEFLNYLQWLKNKQLIDEIKALKSENDKEFFWTFYDKMRPRYSKIGFVLLEIENQFYILEIKENLVSNQKHEKEIDFILKQTKK